MCAWLTKAKADGIDNEVVNYQANSLAIMLVQASQPARRTAIFNL